MSDFPESHHDLLESSTAILSTVGKSGIPQTTLERPEFSLFILDLANPQRYLVVRGRATLTPDVDCVFGDKMGKKYGHDMRSMLRDDEIRYQVTFNPVSIAVR